LAAWERFAAGDDNVQGIPPPILLSWYRCRDVHKVDPQLSRPPAASGRGSHRLVHGSVYAQLGGIASAIVERSENSLATVTDGAGRVLACWGRGEVRNRAVDSNLAPFFAWSEAATGTNGMGTAIMQQQPVLVRGPEHWRQALHDWTCAGVAIHDPVTHQPLAALNVSSCWGDEVPVLVDRLAADLDAVRSSLHEQALQDGLLVSRAFIEADRSSRDKLLAVDIAGNIIAANEAARALLDGLPNGFLLDPTSRGKSGCAALRSIVTQSVDNLRDDPHWVGVADIGAVLTGRSEMFSLVPVNSTDGVIGWVLSSGRGTRDGAEVTSAPVPAPAPDHPSRIVAFQEGHVLLLSPSEIRYAEADRHAVWLTTDVGRVRAATRGMDHVERELTPFGFIRVHRSYLVNVERIREVDYQGKGILTVSTAPNKNELIPVSRRNAAVLRGLLGL
jgi:hypothetical protein